MDVQAGYQNLDGKCIYFHSHLFQNQLTKNKNTVENEELIQVRQEVGDLVSALLNVF